MFNFSFPLLLFVFSLIIGGCSATRPRMPPLASVEGVTGHFAEGRIIDLKNGKSISFEQLIDNLQVNDLVFVGEVHNNPEHHLMEVQILQALTAAYSPMTVAMEFFDTTRQPVLDRYMEKEAGETKFLKDVEWRKGWSFPYYFYRPLIFTVEIRGMKLSGSTYPPKSCARWQDQVSTA